MKSKMTGFDYFVYYLFCVFTFGGLFIYKTIVKKALSEMID